jgi:hypothetical protein
MSAAAPARATTTTTSPPPPARRRAPPPLPPPTAPSLAGGGGDDDAVLARVAALDAPALRAAAAATTAGADSVHPPLCPPPPTAALAPAPRAGKAPHARPPQPTGSDRAAPPRPTYGPPPPPSPLPPPARLFRDRLPRGRLEMQPRRAVGLVAPTTAARGGATRLVDAAVRLTLTAHGGNTWDGTAHVPGVVTAPPSAPSSGLQPLHYIVWPDGGGDPGSAALATLHLTHALPLAHHHHHPQPAPAADGTGDEHDDHHHHYPPPLLAYTVEDAASAGGGGGGGASRLSRHHHHPPPLGWGACSGAGLLAQLAAAASAATASGTSGSSSGWVDVCLPLAPGAPPPPSTAAAHPPPPCGTLLGHALPPPATASGCYLAARVRFTPLVPGLLTVALHGAAWCVDRDSGSSGTQDPYVRIVSSVPGGGGPSATSVVLEEGGTDVDFRGQVLRLWMGPHSWGAPLTVTALDRDGALKRDDLIGSVAFDPVREGWLTPAAAAAGGGGDGDGGGSGGGTLVTLPMYAPDVPGRPCGHLTLRRAFHPAGELTVRVCEARRLGAGGDGGDGDGDPRSGFLGGLASSIAPASVAPVVELATDSVLAPADAQGRATLPARAGGGAGFPVWTTTTPPLCVDVLDATALRVTVTRAHHHHHSGGGSGGHAVGAGTLPLAPLYRDGVADGWLPLVHAGRWGGTSAAGDLRLEVDFTGPAGAAFPAFRPGEPAHDDRARLSRYDGDPRLLAAVAAVGTGTVGGSPKAARRRQQLQPPPTTPTHDTTAAASGASGGVMSQRDIEAAFDGLDLDGNLYVGAGELRHVLACMGEAVSDEEINAMLALVDADGDGQVSLDEFAALMRRPDGGNDGDGGAGLPLPAPPPQAALHRAASVGTAVKAAALAPPPPIITLRGGGGGGGSGAGAHAARPSVVVVGSNPAARRAALAARDEMEARAAKRDACRAFVAAARLSLPDLARWAAAASGGAAAGLTQPASPTRLAADFAASAGAGRAGVDTRALADLLAPFVAAAAAVEEEEVLRESCGDGRGVGAPRNRPHAVAAAGAPRVPPPPSTTAAPPSPAAASSTAAAVTVTVRSLLLSLSACVGATREARTLFAFSLLDPLGGGERGVLGRRELGELLAAQHLLGPRGGWVARKTDTLLGMLPPAATAGSGTAAAAAGGGAVDLATFRALAAQFGGLLLPEQ